MTEELQHNEDLIPLPLKQEMMAAAIAKGVSYQWLCGLFLQGFHAQIVGPDSKVPGEGEEEPTTLSITPHPDLGKVIINFSKLIKAIHFSGAQAKEMGEHLLLCARDLKAHTSTHTPIKLVEPSTKES